MAPMANGPEPTETSAHEPMRRHLHIVPDYQPTTDGVMHLARIGRLELELGGSLPDVTIAYRTWGTLNDNRTNAVLVLHALTGDSLAAGIGGWWEPVIGECGAIDTRDHFVVCANVLGGCQGSTGPASKDPDGAHWGARFPLITIGDIVTAQRRLIDHLGIRKLVAIGGSIGGFQALEWATRYPELTAGAGVIAASGSLPAMGIAVHGEIGRRAIMSDPDWRGGNYLNEGVFPAQGLAIARMVAMTTYHSPQSLGSRFGRNQAVRPPLYSPFGPTFDVEGYLHYHGQALVQRFDANSYLYLSRAMDLYDVGRNGGEDAWFDRIAAPVLLVGISSDWLFPPGDVRQLAERISWRGKDATYREIVSPNGHDAFLKDWDQLTPIVGEFMASVSPRAPQRLEQPV